MASNKGKGAAIAAVGIGAGLLAMLAFRGKASAAVPKKRVVKGDQALAVELAMKYAKIFGAPASLLIALIQIESNNKADAVNLNNARGGAWGFTQMTLATAKDLTAKNPAVAKKYWPKFDGTGKSLLDPHTNIAMAAFHLAQLWKKYERRPGNWLTAGLAWHQGPGNIDKFIAAGKGKIVPTSLPPKGKTYYGWLKNQLTSNIVVANVVTQEQETGRFKYA